jgi:sugar lactone lactonase YvrE
MSRDVATVLSGFSYLECPRWHDGRIWFSDFYTYRVFSAVEGGGDLRVEAEVPQQPSGLGWLPDGRLLIASMRDCRLLRREPDGALVVHAELGGAVTGHPNDMVVDAHGRAFLGNFGFDLMGGAPVETADLLRIDPDGTVAMVASDMWFANGSVITDTRGYSAASRVASMPAPQPTSSSDSPGRGASRWRIRCLYQRNAGASSAASRNPVSASGAAA